MYPILMTATINPGPNVKYSVVNDPAARWKHYAEAISFWLSRSTVKDIIFCENSGYPVDYASVLHLADIYGKTLEIVSYSGNASAPSRGKGYSEGEIINYALATSAILRAAPGFYKVTGRLTVLNFNFLDSFYAHRPTAFTKFSGLSDLGVDSRFFKVSVPYYETVLKDAYTKVDETANFPIERAYLLAIRSARQPVSSFWPLPDIRGVAASTGAEYPTGFSRRLIRNALALAGLWRVNVR